MPKKPNLEQTVPYEQLSTEKRDSGSTPKTAQPASATFKVEVSDPDHVKAVKALNRAKERAFDKGWGQGFAGGYIEGFATRDAEARSNRAPLVALGCILVAVAFYLGTLVG